MHYVADTATDTITDLLNIGFLLNNREGSMLIFFTERKVSRSADWTAQQR
jgi:hypothetical protein